MNCKRLNLKHMHKPIYLVYEMPKTAINQETRFIQTNKLSL